MKLLASWRRPGCRCCLGVSNMSADAAFSLSTTRCLHGRPLGHHYTMLNQCFKFSRKQVNRSLPSISRAWRVNAGVRMQPAGIAQNKCRPQALHRGSPHRLPCTRRPTQTSISAHVARARLAYHAATQRGLWSLSDHPQGRKAPSCRIAQRSGLGDP